MKSEQGEIEFTISFTEFEYEVIHALAKRRGKTVTSLVTEAICDFFADPLYEVKLDQLLQRRQARLRRWEEVKP